MWRSEITYTAQLWDNRTPGDGFIRMDVTFLSPPPWRHNRSQNRVNPMGYT